MRHDAARSRALTDCGGSASLAAARKERFNTMPAANFDPRSRRPAVDPRARRVVRVGLYQRLPTLGESDFLQSYVASQPDWRVALRSSDDGSGATLKRPGLQRVLAAARSGAIDVLVVNHMYNLSRTTRHLAFLLDELTSRGVRVVSVADPGLDTETPFGLFLVRVVNAVAEIEYTGARADRRDRLRHEQESGNESPLAGAPQRTRQIRRANAATNTVLIQNDSQRGVHEQRLCRFGRRTAGRRRALRPATVQ
jgi:hypothetical protein